MKLGRRVAGESRALCANDSETVRLERLVKKPEQGETGGMNGERDVVGDCEAANGSERKGEPTEVHGAHSQERGRELSGATRIAERSVHRHEPRAR